MTDTVSVVIVGAGFAGLAMAAELLRAGIDDFLILEKADRAGGVWRENTYPGAACDVPSPYYSFSYAPKPDWNRRYAGQAQIEGYLTDIASTPEVRKRIRYDVDVTDARFEEADGLWILGTADGRSVRARILVPATGQLSRPAMPDIAGRERFEGTSFHSARWHHDADLRGRRVAVIGAGASVIQFVPRIQPEVARLTLFQRSAPYILPKPDGEYRPIHHSVFRRLPLLQTLERGLWWTLGEVWTLGITGNRPISAAVEAAARWQLRRQVASAALRQKLTPDYPIGCKRVLFANDYYPALTEPDVDLVTERITEITARGIRTADGVEHAVDVIIYGTGFATQEFLGPMTVRGRAGRELGAAWAEGARAHLGMTVPGFPNMFLMYGPNTNLGTGSIIYMLERQARYIRQAVEVSARNGGGVLEIRAEVEQRYDDEIQRRLAGSAWTGCVSWYKSASGRISSNWPGTVSEYSRRTATLALADFHVSAAPREAGVAEATS
ncbi:flavin-containing monooxygenase [Nocardia thailandica]|uniref:flavin-containing monooxygenase n=1 Tax=Nocardia thailandica TaxID=257275 RepID=UPI0002D5C85D|nr:NAD(P)/FAD-dependent oxidoreductase [Nocardia thailandica]